MSSLLPPSVTVLVDSREKHPLLFPDRLELRPQPLRPAGPRVPPIPVVVHTQRKRLLSGDYTLRGCESLVAVERKGSIAELCGNVGAGDCSRFCRAIRRFAQSCIYPYLYLEFLPRSVWTAPPAYRECNTRAVLDIVLATAAELNLRLIWGGRQSPQPAARRALGEIILRLMLHHLIRENW